MNLRQGIAFLRNRRYSWSLLLALFVAPAAAAAQPAFNATELAKKVSPSVVLFQGKDAAGAGIVGTGFIISPDGMIVTCLHVIEWMENGTVQLASGRVFNNFLVRALDERRDLVVIQIPGINLPAVELGDSDELQAGDSILVIGNAEGF